jgi:hypothetical protein
VTHERAHQSARRSHCIGPVVGSVLIARGSDEKTVIVRALAVKQPWAGLIANGTKTTEFRTWSTPYRGPILIVASRGRDRVATEEARRDGHLTATDEAKGATLCVVDLVDVVRNEKEHDYEWKLASPRAVPVTPIKGKLNLYNETVPASWREHFEPRKPRAKGPAAISRAAVPQRRGGPDLATRRATYYALQRAWRAAGCPTGDMCRALIDAERAWKGPRK